MNLKTLALAAAALVAANSATQAAFIKVGTATENRILTDTRWTRDNVYILTRVIFVSNGAVLTIEPGTIVRGLQAGALIQSGRNVSGSGLAQEPGSLVIARGAKLIANGTADDPIIFTSLDDPHVPGGAATVPTSVTNTQGGVITTASLTQHDYSPSGAAGDNAFSKAGRWGGVVLCGNAYVAQTTTPIASSPADATNGALPTSAVVAPTLQNNGVGSDFVEGLSDAGGGTVVNSSLAIYGGTNDTESSGVLRFVSSRFGGYLLGNPASANEINGLTVCAAGSGTILEWIEVYQNADDGYEWFGGKHDTRFLFSIANHDDCFDCDEGMRGTHQFWTAVQGTRNILSDTAPLRNASFGGGYIIQEVTDSDHVYDKLLEWDGGESDHGDRLPATHQSIYNFTMLASNTVRQNLMHIRRESQCFLYNGIVENAQGVSRVDRAGDATVNLLSTITWDNMHSFNITGDSPAGNSTGATTGLVQTTTLVQEAASQLVGAFTRPGSVTFPNLYAKNALDLRLAAGVASRTDTGTSATGLVQTNHAGSMMDNNFLAGWSILEYLQVVPTTNVARPAVTLTLSGANPVVNFATANPAFKYSIEKSTDQKTWTPVTVQSAAATVSYTDTATTLGSTPVFYRAYAL